MHFVLADDDCEDVEAREAVGRSLDQYLVGLGKPDAREDATYHTMTLSICTSRVHWGWIRRGGESGRPEDAIVGEQIVGRKVHTPLLARTGRSPSRAISGEGGEPHRNRTYNPQIKSLLLCQLS